MQRFSITTPNGPLVYTVIHRPRVTKRVHMELDEWGDLVVVAPRHWSKKKVDNVLVQNTSRVIRFLNNARKRQLEPLRFIHGELHLYQGNQYPLNIRTAPVRKAVIHYDGVEIRAVHRPGAKVAIQTLMHEWYRLQALRVFTARLALISATAPWVKDRVIPLMVRKMKRTWGNCSSGGVIKLNTHLIKAPLKVIDSVIAHELCHLREMNHGQDFYRLLEGLNPDWRRDRKKLRAEGDTYLR